MIWQNPWAWLGLLALAVPVLIHLLGRRSARVQRFPTLRFVAPSQPMATRRTRITDVPLLLVRMGILAAAVAALALPLLLTADRERDLGRALARAIIVDTSASMTGAGSDTSVAARASDAATSVVIRTREPALALRGAVAWLGNQPGRREVVVVSDFQTGTIDSADLAYVPRDIGVALVQVATTPLRAPTRPAPPPADDGLLVLAAEGERPRAEAARRAAAALVGDIRVPAVRPVVVVHDGYEGRDALMRSAQPLSAPWQGDLLVRLRNDPTLAAAAAVADLTPLGGVRSSAASLPATLTAVARTTTREPVLVAAADREDGRDRLLLFLRSDAGSLVSAATFVAVARAASPAPNVAEREPSRLDEATLAAWRRPPAAATTTRSADDPGESDGRWLWILALALLGAESWMRRGRRDPKTTEVVHERAA